MNLLNKKKKNLSYSNCQTPNKSVNKSLNDKLEGLSARNKRKSNPDIFKNIPPTKIQEKKSNNPNSNSLHMKANSEVPSLSNKKTPESKYGLDLKLNLKAIEKNKPLFKNNEYYAFDRSVFMKRKSSLPTKNNNKSNSKENSQTQKPLSNRKPIKANGNPMKINIVNANNYLMINHPNTKIENPHSNTSPTKKIPPIFTRELQQDQIRKIEAKTHSIIDYNNDQTDAGNLTSRNETANQDSILVMNCLAGNPNTHMFGVADGHGKFGQIVSNFVLYHVSDILTNDPDLNEEPEKALGRSFYFVNKKLSGFSIDTSLSGSTLLVLMMTKEKLLCANVGDSRAIIVKGSGKSMEVLPLSVDHKPTIEEEAKRIRLMGGRIEPMKDENQKHIGPVRIWLGPENFPGLTLSRSMGDLIASQIGVISEPEIIECDLNEEGLNFILIGTDGVWNMMTNEEVAKVIDPFTENGEIDAACEALMLECQKRWNKQNEFIVDDISFIAIFFNRNL